MNNGIYPQNYRSNRHLSNDGGIPVNKAKWILRNDDLRSLLNSFFLDESRIYVRTPDGDASFCIDISNKDILWNVSEVNNDGEVLSINGNQVTLGWVTYDISSGTRIADARVIVGEDIEEYDFGLSYADGYITKIRGENPEQIYIDLVNNSYQRLGCNLEYYQISEDQTLLYGWNKNWLQCFNLETKELVWQFETPVLPNGKAKFINFVVQGDVLYLTQHVSDILCLSTKTGELIWKKEGSKKVPDSDSPHKHLASNGLLVFDDNLYMGCRMNINGWLGCYSIDDGAEQWRIENIYYEWPAGAGDLIFDICDEHTKLKAFDRFSGEIVWEAKEKMVAGGMVLISGNNIICNTTNGELYCYEWKDPYVSPARLKT